MDIVTKNKIKRALGLKGDGALGEVISWLPDLWFMAKVFLMLMLVLLALYGAGLGLLLLLGNAVGG